MRCCAQIGSIRLFGRYQQPKNVPLGVRYLKQACEKRDGLACLVLGRAHYFGKGLPLDRKLATHYFDGACRQEVAIACNYLAEVHERGLAGTVDTDKGHDLRLRACALGEASACLLLGRRAASGDAQQKRDCRRASYFFGRACRFGMKRACRLTCG